jgi:SAM-dependent methyltransferase
LTYVSQQVRNKLRAFLQAYGPRGVKRSLWNAEFSGGRWDCLESSGGDVVYPFIEKYANRGNILDLGCGSGSTGNELIVAAYSDYTGVDIADLAIEKARIKTKENCRADKNHYFQSDISTYTPTRQFDVILFRDSIYYVPPAKVRGMLERYSPYLKDDGVFIVRMWNVKGKYKLIVGTIERNFDVVEKYLSNEPSTAILVFRSRSRP